MTLKFEQHFLEQDRKLLESLQKINPNLLEELFRRNIRGAYSLVGVNFPNERRDVSERYFVEVAKELANNPKLQELYLTIHTPTHCIEKGIASHRLWLMRPFIGGHPDWGCQSHIAIIEMWKKDPIYNPLNHRCYDWATNKTTPYEEVRLKFDDELVKKIIDNPPQPEIIQNYQDYFCHETRLYQLKLLK